MTITIMFNMIKHKHQNTLEYIESFLHQNAFMNIYMNVLINVCMYESIQLHHLLIVFKKSNHNLNLNLINN